MKRPPFPPAVEIEHLRAELARAEATLPALKSAVRERRLARMKEEVDLERAEGEGLVAFFERLVGERRDLVAKEKAEAASARLKFDTALAMFDAARSRTIELSREIERLERAQQRVGARIAREGHSGAAHALQLELREIEEASDAAARALECIGWMDESLRSAKGWGTWDMLGGGMFSSWMKHSRLDQAHAHMASLQSALDRLGRELGDVGMAGPGALRIDGFARFADWFFDGFFVDWMVQDRIHESSARLAGVRQRVEGVRSELEARERRAREELALLPNG